MVEGTSKATQTIYVLGYPKSGTTWLARLLGDALNSPVGAVKPDSDHLTIATEGKDRPGSYYIRQGHSVPIDDYPSPVVPAHPRLAYRNLTNEKIVIMVRDPRDIAVSVQHHWRMDSLEKAVRCMIHGEWPIPHGKGWMPWVDAWLDDKIPVCCWTSYERLYEDPQFELSIILDVLGIAEPPTLRDVVKRQSFAVRRQWTEQHGDDLPYGKEFQLRFLRRGIVGDWKTHDWGGSYDLAMEHWGELMRELGYDPSSL